MKNPNSRLSLWALKLQHHKFFIVHHEGAIHQNANGLSRLTSIVYLASKEDRIYDLFGLPGLWDFKAPAVKDQFRLMTASSQIKAGMLYKMVVSL